MISATLSHATLFHAGVAVKYRTNRLRGNAAVCQMQACFLIRKQIRRISTYKVHY